MLTSRPQDLHIFVVLQLGCSANYGLLINRDFCCYKDKQTKINTTNEIVALAEVIFNNISDVKNDNILCCNLNTFSKNILA